MRSPAVPARGLLYKSSSPKAMVTETIPTIAETRLHRSSTVSSRLMALIGGIERMNVPPLHRSLSTTLPPIISDPAIAVRAIHLNRGEIRLKQINFHLLNVPHRHVWPPADCTADTRSCQEGRPKHGQSPPAMQRLTQGVLDGNRYGSQPERRARRRHVMHRLCRLRKICDPATLERKPRPEIE